jgi:dienelactone hydrolase
MVHPKSHIHLVPFVAVALAFFLALAATPALAQMSMRLIPFDSVTLSSQQVLLGETQGKPVTLAGELRLPNLGTGKVPVVVLDHGIAGLTANHDEWARVLNGWGIAAFIPDHLSGRGIAPMSPDDYMLSPLARMVDVYHALSRLSKEPRIDSERIALMGFSFGGLVTLLSSQERFRTRYGLPNVQFAAYIPVYANCAYRFHDDAKVAARPIRLFHGAGDNWCPVEQCRALVADMKKAGADVTLTEYAGASHAYDDKSLKVRLNLPQAPSLRKCLLVEGEGGQILNSQTGKPLAPNDSCIEYGVSLQYDEAATMGTREAVKAVLASALAAKPAAAAPASEVLKAKGAPAIPSDIQIVQPDPSSPKGLSAFLGKWEATDSNGVTHLTIIENINEEKATVYAWWNCCPGPDTWQKYGYRVIKESPDKYTLVLHIVPTPRLDTCGENVKILLEGSDLINTCPGYLKIRFHRATSW